MLPAKVDKALSAVCAVAIGLIICSMLGVFEGSHSNADEAAIRKLMDQIAMGSSAKEVQRRFDEAGDTRLELKKIDYNVWLITTPFRIGATNWQLWIRFSRGDVESLKVRLMDSDKMHPPNAPPDKS